MHKCVGVGLLLCVLTAPLFRYWSNAAADAAYMLGLFLEVINDTESILLIIQSLPHTPSFMSRHLPSHGGRVKGGGGMATETGEKVI